MGRKRRTVKHVCKMEAEAKGEPLTEQSRRRKIASLVVFDTETSSFGNSKKRQKITELCFLSVQTDDIKAKNIPRVINKLTLCLNPECPLPPAINSFTGLYNDHLEHMPTFREVVPLITGFWATQPRPLCIIAHNGNRFDFPILQAEFHEAGHELPPDPDILCADSLEAFRMLDGLPAVPEWVLKKEMKQQKQASHAASTAPSFHQEQASCSNNEAVSTCQAKEEVKDTSNDGLSGGETAVTSSSDDHQTDDRCKGQGLEEEPDASTGVSTPPKMLRLEEPTSASDFSYEPSVTDLQLAEARGALYPEVSHNKRQGLEEEPDASTGVSTPPKMLRLEEPTSVSDFSSQPSVKDSRLTEACGALHPEVFHSSAQGNPHMDEAQVVPNAWQPENQSTPPQDIASPPQIDVAEQFIKRGQPAYSSSDERDRVSRRLFQNNDNNSTESAADQVSSFCTEIPLSNTKKVTDLDSKGSITDEDFLALTQEVEAASGITSLLTESEAGVDGSEKLLQGNAESENIPQNCSSDNAGKICSTADPPSRKPSSSSAADSPASSGKPAATRTRQVSYSLGEIHRRTFGKGPEIAHTAEDDCKTLLRVILHRTPEFLAWLEEHSVPLDSVQSVRV